MARSVGPCCIRVRPCAEPTRTASEVARLTQDLREQQSELRESSQKLVAQLKACLDRIGLATDESNRWNAANRGAELLAAIKSAPDDEVVARLADAPLEPSAQAVGTTLKRSAEVAQALETAPWTVLDGIRRLAESHPPKQPPYGTARWSSSAMTSTPKR